LAVNDGYILTDEEITQCQEKTDNIMKNIPAETLDENELTKDEIISIQEKIALSTRYYNNLLSDLDIDEADIRANIDPQQYQQFDIQYIFAQKQDYDALEGMLESAKTTDDITTLATDSKFNTGYATFLKGENYFGEEANLEEAILGMQKGEVSDLIETSKGYYIIKLKDNTSTSKYDDAVKAELEKEVEAIFTPEYEKIKKEHEITINDKAWDKIEIDTQTEELKK
jgi:foldase protein PrsA